jgi:diguanylate cyclase (GGDEF)-like protein
VYQLVVADEQKRLDEFTKKVIKTRLMWLNKLFQEKNQYMIDELTGLYTRKKFIIDLKENYNKPGIFINIKHFGDINDLYGLEFGDRFLKEFGLLLKNLGGTEKTYRVYGDKFCVVFESINQVFEFRDRLLLSIASGFKIYNEKLGEFVDLKINISSVIITSIDEHSLEDSNLTFKEIPKIKKNHIIFETDIYPFVKKEKEILGFIENAVKEDNVIPAYQKIINLKNPEDFYFEALMRLKVGSKLIYPVEFIEVSKKHGFYPKLSEMLFIKILEDIKKFNINVSINLEALDLLRDNFFSFIKIS